MFAIELKWLEDFLSLCDTRNFRLASEHQCVSQPAFRPVALEIVHIAYQSRNNIYADIGPDVGRIRFSTVSTLAQFFVPSWLKKLRPLLETESLSVKTDFDGVSDYLEALENDWISR